MSCSSRLPTACMLTLTFLGGALGCARSPSVPAGDGVPEHTHHAHELHLPSVGAQVTVVSETKEADVLASVAHDGGSLPLVDVWRSAFPDAPLDALHFDLVGFARDRLLTNIVRRSYYVHTTFGRDDAHRRSFSERESPMNTSLVEEVGAGLDGLAQLRALMASGRKPGILLALDFDFVEVEAGRAVFAGSPGEHAYNPIGSVHGGYAATLLDSACGCAVHSRLSPAQGYTTLELKVAYHKAITRETGRLRAEGRVVSVGRRAAFAEATLTDEAGRLYASATSTLLVFERGAGASAAGRAA